MVEYLDILTVENHLDQEITATPKESHTTDLRDSQTPKEALFEMNRNHLLEMREQRLNRELKHLIHNTCEESEYWIFEYLLQKILNDTIAVIKKKPIILVHVFIA